MDSDGWTLISVLNHLQPVAGNSVTAGADCGAILHEVSQRELEVAASQALQFQSQTAERYQYAMLCTVVLTVLATFEALQAIAARASGKSAAYPIVLVAMNLLTAGWTGFNAWRRWVEARSIAAFLKWCASELEQYSGQSPHQKVFR